MSTSATARPKSRVSRAEARERIVEAATELVRQRSFAQITVGEVMDQAGLERTIFYRHFENIGELLLSAGREAIEQLYAAQIALSSTRDAYGTEPIHEAIEVCVRVFHEHGPVLRAAFDAIGSGALVAPREQEFRRSFDGLVAEALRAAGVEVSEPEETARALNTMNTRYLLDTFGREPTTSVETATRTLTEIWSAMLNAGGEPEHPRTRSAGGGA